MNLLVRRTRRWELSVSRRATMSRKKIVKILWVLGYIVPLIVFGFALISSNLIYGLIAINPLLMLPFLVIAHKLALKKNYFFRVIAYTSLTIYILFALYIVQGVAITLNTRSYINQKYPEYLSCIRQNTIPYIGSMPYTIREIESDNPEITKFQIKTRMFPYIFDQEFVRVCPKK